MKAILNQRAARKEFRRNPNAEEIPAHDAINNYYFDLRHAVAISASQRRVRLRKYETGIKARCVTELWIR